MVDDELEIRELICGELEDISPGLDVVSCNDGEAAWASIQAQSVDLLISDIKMPRMSGLELLEKVQGMSAFLKPKQIMMVSGYVPEGTIFAESGVMLVNKPVDFEQFRVDLTSILSSL